MEENHGKTKEWKKTKSKKETEKSNEKRKSDKNQRNCNEKTHMKAKPKITCGVQRIFWASWADP